MNEFMHECFTHSKGLITFTIIVITVVIIIGAKNWVIQWEITYGVVRRLLCARVVEEGFLEEERMTLDGLLKDEIRLLGPGSFLSAEEDFE